MIFTVLEFILMVLTVWLLGSVWTVILMAEPGVSRLRLLMGGLLWPILTIVMVLGVVWMAVSSPFRRKQPADEDNTPAEQKV